jgi:RNA-directed DNA polymerase
MESSLCEKPERHASRRLSDHLTFEGQKQKVHSLVDKVYSRMNLKLAWERVRANRGANYFAVGHSSECFSFIKDWVEKKIRRHLAHSRKQQGFGWTRWNRRWLYDTLRLFNGYRVRRDPLKVAPAR